MWWAGVENINSKNFKSNLGMKEKLRKISEKKKTRGEIRNNRYERLEGKEEGEKKKKASTVH